MARVLVVHNDPILSMLFARTCQETGYHTLVVETPHAALAVLRTTLHPLVVVSAQKQTEWDAPYPLFGALKEQWDIYGRHRYIAVHNWELSAEDQALLTELQVRVFSMPCSFSEVMQAVVHAVATLDT